MMTSEDIRTKCIDLVEQQLDVDRTHIRDDTQFIDDLGADSLAIVEMVLAAEEQFEVDIPDEDVEKLHTVGDGIKYIERRMLEKARPAGTA